ncbi:MAG: tetratricopeptide repeat protein [Planctomycetia bacterium]|nr:tetratricopeptide repeat protein [Planctomycetia bacterium]
MIRSFRSSTRVTAIVSAVSLGLGLFGPRMVARGDENASSDAAKTAYASAAALQNREAWDLAAEEWQALLAKHPQDPLAAKGRYYLAICQIKSDLWPEASKTLRNVIGSKADAATIALARWELGRGMFQAAQAKPSPEAYAAAAQAVKEFLDANTQATQAAEAAHLLGEALWQAGRRDEAVATWKAFVRDRAESPRLPDVLYALGIGQAETGDRDGAAATLARFATDFPKHTLAGDVVLWRADLAVQGGKPDEARPLLAQALASGGPAALRVAHKLALVELDAKRPAQALDVATKALDAAKSQPDADAKAVAALRLDRADALWELPGRRREATAAYAAIADDPGSSHAATAISMTALGLLQDGKPAEALGRADAFLAKHGATAAADTVADVKAIRAEALLMLGKHADAAQAYHDLVAANPKPPQRAAWLLREAAALAADRKWAEVHTLLAAATPGLTGDQQAEALLLDATALVELKQPKPATAALAALGKSHAAWSRRDEALLLEVRALREAGDTSAALAAAERLVKEFPQAKGADVAWYRLGQLRQEAGRPDEAITAFAKSWEINPKGNRSPWALLATGWCHEAKGRMPEAIKAWTECIAAYPDSSAATAALLARADVRQRSGDFSAGLADAEQLLKAAADKSMKLDEAAAGEARLLQGLCLAGEKKYAQAAAAYQKLLQERPSFAAADRVLFELGVAQSLAAKPADATATFADLVKRFPTSGYAADAWMEIGEARWAAGEWTAAAQAYEATLAAAGTAPERALLVEQARHKLGWTFVMKKDHARAAEAFAAQLAAAPKGTLAADAQAMLGESLLALDKPADAAKAFAAAVASADKLSSADMRAAAFIRAAEAAARERKWDESLTIAKRFLEAEPASPRVAEGRYAAAWAKQNLGRLDEALADYRAIADSGRTELAARGRLMEGEVLFEQGNHKEAVKSFFKVAYGFGEQQAPPAFHPWQAQATFEAARCFEVLGKPEQSRTLYTELVERYPQSEHVAASRKRLDVLGAVSPTP